MRLGIGRRKETYTYQFLRNHPTHTDPHDMQLPLLRPAHMINHLEQIARHLRRRVPHERLVALTHPTIIHNQRGILVRLLVRKVLSLALPGPLEATQSHDPLSTQRGKKNIRTLFKYEKALFLLCVYLCPRNILSSSFPPLLVIPTKRKEKKEKEREGEKHKKNKTKATGQRHQTPLTTIFSGPSP